MHDGRVAALRPRARHGTVAGTMVFRLREAAARNRHRGADSNVATDQEGAVLGEGAELGQDVLPRAPITARSSAVMYVEKSFATLVTLMAARLAIAT